MLLLCGILITIEEFLHNTCPFYENYFLDFVIQQQIAGILSSWAEQKCLYIKKCIIYVDAFLRIKQLVFMLKSVENA